MIWETEGVNPNWPLKPLEKLATKVGSGATPRGGRSSYPDQGTPFIRSQNVHFGGFTTDGLAFLTDEQARQLDGVTVQTGDVLLNITGASIGRVCIAPPEMAGARVNQHVSIIRPVGVRPDFLAKYLASPQVQNAIFMGNYGVTREALTKSQILELPVPVPDDNEQDQIVAILNSFDSHQAEAKTQISQAYRSIERCCKSILLAACSGRLTENWRTAHGQPEWRHVPAQSLCAKVQSGGTPKTGFTDEPGIPFLKVYNIVDQRVDFSYRPQYVPECVHSGVLKKSIAYPGDVIMNIVGPPLGKVAIIPDTYPEWNLNQAITIFRPSPDVLGEWLYFYLCSGTFLDDEDLITRGSAGQSNISLTQCRNLIIPVPSLDEQHEIISRVSGFLSTTETLLMRITAAERAVKHTSQAILARAFHGDLAPANA